MKKSSVMKLLGVILLSLPLCFATAGAQEVDKGGKIGTQVQALASDCTLLRPLSWSGSGVTCLEKLTTTFPLANGKTYTAISSVSGPLYGQGYTRVRCDNGRIRTEVSVCKKSGGVQN